MTSGAMFVLLKKKNENITAAKRGTGDLYEWSQWLEMENQKNNINQILSPYLSGKNFVVRFWKGIDNDISRA